MSGIVGLGDPELRPVVRPRDGPGEATCAATASRARWRCPAAIRATRAGLEAGLREIASAAGMSLILYLKSEDGFGSDQEAGLDAVARLVADGTCVAIKYAVVRKDPAVGSLPGRAPRARRPPPRGQRDRRAAGDRPHARLPAARLHDRLRLPRPALTSALFAACSRARLGRAPRRCARIPAARGSARRLGPGARAARGARARRRREDGADPAVRDGARDATSARRSSRSRASCCGSTPRGARLPSAAAKLLRLQLARRAAGACARRRPRCTPCRAAARLAPRS